MLFRKKSKSEITSVNEFDEYSKQYLQLNSDIKYLKSQWNTYIQKSLEDDLSLYQLFAESSYPDKDSTNKYWTMTELGSSTFKLEKKSDIRWKSLRIRCHYTFDDENGKLNISDVSCEGNDLKNTKELIAILSKYFYLMKINNKKRDSNHARKSFDEMMKIVGKDTIRDARIDNILKDL